MNWFKLYALMSGAIVAGLVIMAPSSRQVRSGTLKKWVYLETYLSRPAEVKKTIDLIDKIADQGYDGLIVSDSGLQSFRQLSAAYVASVDQVKQKAAARHIDLIPMSASIGRAGPILSRDLSLVESMKCENVRFVVKDGKLALNEPPIQVENGDFQLVGSNSLNGFSGHAEDGVELRQDLATTLNGVPTISFEAKQDTPTQKHGVFFYTDVHVSPWHQYQLSLWTRAEGKGGHIYVDAQTVGQKALSTSPRWKPTTEWVKNSVVFNSQDNAEIKLHFGVQPPVGSKIWVSTLSIQDAGLLNVTRRATCPLVVRGEDGVAYKEGPDYNPIYDPLAGKNKYAGNFDVFHTPPAPTVPTTSQLTEGQTVYLDYYTAVVNFADQVSICLSEPASVALLKDNIDRLTELFQPKYIFFPNDEVRALGWDPACEKSGLSSGKILGNFLTTEVEYAKSKSPDITCITYSDMLDPYHNAGGDYYRLRGSGQGSVDGIPTDVVIANWNGRKSQESYNFFRKRGFRQILFGYYDNNGDILPLPKWIDKLGDTSDLYGVGYATWTGDYSQLGPYFEQIKRIK